MLAGVSCQTARAWAPLSSEAPQALDILKAEEVIAVNQDALGVAGDLIWKEGSLEVRGARCLA